MKTSAFLAFLLGIACSASAVAQVVVIEWRPTCQNRMCTNVTAETNADAGASSETGKRQGAQSSAQPKAPEQTATQAYYFPADGLSEDAQLP